MSNDIFKGQWRQVEGKLKERFSKLTDNDLGEAEGKMDVLLGKLQEKYGWTKAEAQAQLDSLR
ncbi:CsbD family protein [Simiduia sp. 21SJ11W-1]|uniref:CsbD family protein n=1 Tax=Simiduia sp. 21SJ11W-1 TaxID=2909669 RepID=UPI00209F2648|nr:CsbD family protein [Simiduia sp. 21SJ11W-1]UTA48513.1 CsbD family protein [Simiduia sp. 21SJ11W-1]